MNDNTHKPETPSFKKEMVRRFNPLTSRKKTITALSLGVIYLLHGFVFGSWHPFWVIFLILPILVLFRYDRIRVMMRATLIALMLNIALYMGIGYFTEVYHPTWIILLTPIFIALLMEKHPLHKWMLEGFLLLALASYLLIGLLSGEYELAFFSFLLFIIPAIFTGHIYIHLHAIDTLIVRIGLILSFIVFFTWGYFFDAYGIAWIALLTVPSLSVAFHAKGRDTLVPFSIFVSLLLFYALGYYTGAWHIVWLIFFMGPAVSIAQKIW